jgi:hypothetical protein
LKNGDSLDKIKSKKEGLGTPKSGWSSFMNKLFELQILKLPHYSSIPGYYETLDTDENGYTIEVAEKERYKIYSYPNPKSRQNKFGEAKKMTLMIDLIEKEFNIPASLS